MRRIRIRYQLKVWAANLRCALTGHDWAEYQSESWSIDCKRCGEHFHLAKVIG